MSCGLSTQMAFQGTMHLTPCTWRSEASCASLYASHTMHSMHLTPCTLLHADGVPRHHPPHAVHPTPCTPRTSRHAPHSTQMAFQGTMHLTDKHLCFSVEERGKQLPIKVPLSSINYATRQLPTQKGVGHEIPCGRL
uniref:Uncharacterized protein n=1 Tax=Dunaliella tertiolecta TaxID=3047 RepID=A0A7S3QPN5_DUNTE